MAASRITVSSLISQVRQQIAEENQLSITDADDILPALNRAQDYGVDILARQYPDPLLVYEEVTLTSGTQEYPIPESALEQRLEKIEVKINNLYQEVRRIDFRDISIYESTLSVTTPQYWAAVGPNYRLLPNPLSTYPLRIWYMKDPQSLVKEQGRINLINSGSNYVIVDSVGEDLTTESDQLNSYVNLIDGASGIRKATLQIQNIQGSKITFKTVPLRTSVLDLDVDTALPANLAEDDYLCTVYGSCVPFMKKPFSNFLIQYAVAELRRKMGEVEAGLEQQILDSFEKQLESQWSGRSNSLRVKNRSNNWPGGRRPLLIQG